jgi:subtilase family serine protease
MVALVLLALFESVGAPAQADTDGTPRLINDAVDEGVTVELTGNVRSAASLGNDLGRVDDTMQIEHMQLLLNRPASTEAELVARIEELHDRRSPEYHHWLTADSFGRQFGPAPADIAAVTHWLESHGLVVNGVQKSGMMIDFSGTAELVGATFHTEIHRFLVAGVAHIANVSNPRVPAALAPVVAGVVSLNDFRPHTNFKARADYTFSLNGTTYYAVVPADLATIYNLNPLFAAGISGKGQTIVIIEDSNVAHVGDWTTFRNTFGLKSYASGSLTQMHPAGTSLCANPGVVSGNESEAELDVEWASAAAPSAAIVLASCADTSTTFGGLIALQNLVNGSSPPAIVSISYGECEAENGATANAAYNKTYQQAVAEGTSVYVSAGDEGAASCDANLAIATHGIGVSGFAATPYNVAVGGTDFGDTYAGKNANYWKPGNTTSLGSARSYINEIPWNDSCASVLLAESNGFTATYGSAGFCNSVTGEQGYLTTGAGSGGPSHCATGAPARSGVVGGTCKGYAKPSWQPIFGNIADNVRDIPDVSLFAANGAWNHYYVYCDSDVNDGGAACTGAPDGWSGAGGTSFAAPIWAGFQALVNQKQGAAQGNPNPVLYALAATEYGTSGSPACNSTKGSGVSSTCVFYDVTQGDIDVNCTGPVDCYLPSGTNGVLSASRAYNKAYAAHAGWDFATGIGTVNVENLVNSW